MYVLLYWVFLVQIDSISCIPYIQYDKLLILQKKSYTRYWFVYKLFWIFVNIIQIEYWFPKNKITWKNIWPRKDFSPEWFIAFQILVSSFYGSWDISSRTDDSNWQLLFPLRPEGGIYTFRYKMQYILENILVYVTLLA